MDRPEEQEKIEEGDVHAEDIERRDFLRIGAFAALAATVCIGAANVQEQTPVVQVPNTPQEDAGGGEQAPVVLLPQIRKAFSPASITFG